ncbi:MAG: hypothetical protein ACO3A4_06960, partial [Silvanigrellaceae bacterium]
MLVEHRSGACCWQKILLDLVEVRPQLSKFFFGFQEAATQRLSSAPRNSCSLLLLESRHDLRLAAQVVQLLPRVERAARVVRPAQQVAAVVAELAQLLPRVERAARVVRPAQQVAAVVAELAQLLPRVERAARVVRPAQQ